MLNDDLKHDADLSKRFGRQTDPLCGRALERIEELEAVLDWIEANHFGGEVYFDHEHAPLLLRQLC